MKASQRLARIAGFVLVTVVFLLPPLVRATAHFDNGSASPASFRLNRGFDKPESKWKVVPPQPESVDIVPESPRAASAAEQRAVAEPDSLHDQQHDRSPDPLRGPPRH